MNEVNNGNQIFIGVVENRTGDPLGLGRIKVRVVGLHNHDTTLLPTDDLPWAMVVGNGNSFVSIKEGSTAIVVFNDWPECQMPIVLGTIPGIPQEI